MKALVQTGAYSIIDAYLSAYLTYLYHIISLAYMYLWHATGIFFKAPL